MEVVPFGGFQRSCRLVGRNFEAHLPLEVGPRVLGFGPIGGPNLLNVYQKDFGIKDDGKYHSYGGHRLWVAPEEAGKTMIADSTEPECEPVERGVRLASAVDKFHTQREITATVSADGESLVLEHRVYNRGAYPVELALWAITVMVTDGVCVWPFEDHIAHSQKVLPSQPLVRWGYTDLADPRWELGHEYGAVQQAQGDSQKLGVLVPQGIATYSAQGHTFVKKFPFDATRSYPDYGVNFEVYTRADMLEVESLGPNERIRPGEYASHTEQWFLLENEVAPAGLDRAAWIRDVASRISAKSHNSP